MKYRFLPAAETDLIESIDYYEQCQNGLGTDFSIANFLNFVAAFDYKKSKYERFEDDFPNPNVRGKLSMIDKYALHREKLVGLDVIRLKDYKRRFFVSEKVKKLFEEYKFTGYSFIEVELT
ncbi:MAG TPA: hypothetical protein DCZ94_04955 [Lentisphaeria bacterium]|nr:MAG: hypothetical protein A2X48_07855 [Lentisphaerae bacterium GWF2_49_21]HBC86286.1 hypothetical protein [Lentisphaeria bacterium]